MDAFAPFVRTLGRGPGRSRPLTRGEAAEAFGMVLDGTVDPHQVGAFLMLLRYRGEDPDEITGLVEAARAAIGADGGGRVGIAQDGIGQDGIGQDGNRQDGDGRVMGGAVLRPDLDWPSYGSGRTRGAPWFLLAALALAKAGRRVLMHGSNEFTGGVTVEAALVALGLAPAADLGSAMASLADTRFSYLPLDRLSPALARLIGLRRLLGLRSPVNTVGRLLDPASAGRSVDGVFHPPYIELHLAVAERLGRDRLVVVKGGGGEAERLPVKRLAVHVHDRARGRALIELPRLLQAAVDERGAQGATDAGPGDAALLAAVWRGDAAPAAEVATVIGTIALGLLALEPDLGPEDADRHAALVWERRA